MTPEKSKALIDLITAVVTLFVIYKTMSPSGSSNAKLWYYTSRGLGNAAGFIGTLALRAENEYWKNV